MAFQAPHFPVWVHAVFESFSYAVGFALYRRQRERSGDFLASPDRNSVIVAAILGAALGSKVLGWFESPAELAAHWRDPAWLLGGKTIVGGLLGGTIAVEWTKRRLGITRRTGDLFAIPIAAAIAVGRIGCFFAGLDDHTYGSATALPWSVDFGDGIARHPTQIYESIFALLLVWFLARLERLPHREGDVYRAFLFLYCAWRLAVDFLKPDARMAGLSTLQWACLAGLIWYSMPRVKIAHG